MLSALCSGRIAGLNVSCGSPCMACLHRPPFLFTLCRLIRFQPSLAGVFLKQVFVWLCNMAIVRAASRTLVPATFRALCCGQFLLSDFSSRLQSVKAVAKLAYGRGDLKNHGTSRDLLCHNVRRCHSARATRQSIEAAPVPPEYQTYVDKVKARLETERADLPVGKNGRDDEDLLLWFLRDRNFDVDAAVAKLIEALEWRREFGVDEITEASISRVASIGEAYLHSYPAKGGRPAIIVTSSKQFPNDERLIETRQKHCVYLIEKALRQLPPGGETFLGIFDLRGFQPKNGDLKFVNFLIDVFFKYYPKRLGQVLFVDAPFIFQPGWRMMKPLFGKYAALVQFCSAEDVRNDYFTPDTIPETFKH